MIMNQAIDTVPPPFPVAPDDTEGRIQVAWRELRRGASMQRLRELIIGIGPDALDLGQLDTLELLVRRSRLRMNELADALRIDNSSATRAIARLVDAGLARREPCPGDARGVIVVPTEEGIARWESLSHRWRAAMTDMLTAFQAEERDALADLLDRLVLSLDAWVGRNADQS